jgi:hypothetical protein
VGPRTRKAIAGVVTLLFLAGWIWAAIRVSGYVPDLWWARGLFFGVVGIGWGVPLLPLFSWAERGERRRS